MELNTDLPRLWTGEPSATRTFLYHRLEPAKPSFTGRSPKEAPEIFQVPSKTLIEAVDILEADRLFEERTGINPVRYKGHTPPITVRAIDLTPEQQQRKLAKRHGWKYDSGTETWWHDDLGDGPPPEYEEPVHLKDLGGIAPGATGDQSSVDFVREIREEWE